MGDNFSREGNASNPTGGVWGVTPLPRSDTLSLLLGSLLVVACVPLAKLELACQLRTACLHISSLIFISFIFLISSFFFTLRQPRGRASGVKPASARFPISAPASVAPEPTHLGPMKQNTRFITNLLSNRLVKHNPLCPSFPRIPPPLHDPLKELCANGAFICAHWRSFGFCVSFSKVCVASPLPA